MSRKEEIIRLVNKINRELDHFVPCVGSEIEAKTTIHRYLQDIRSLAVQANARQRHSPGK